MRTVARLGVLGLLLSACGPMGGGDAGVEASVPADGALPSDFYPPAPLAFGAVGGAANTIQVSVSGEALAERGYSYSATPGDEPVFVDGWEVRFSTYLVVVGGVRLSMPGADPTMRGALGGTVATLPGSFLVDLHRTGPLVGAGGAPETAWPLGILRGPDAGGSFDITARYAFSFGVVRASNAMRNINVPASAAADVNELLSHGWTHLFAGTATYRGRAPSATQDASFARFPLSVRFRFGWAAPASYLNCHNPDLGQEDTAATRGVQPSGSAAARAQLTMHTDHFFWDQADVEGTPLHFDPFAARAQGFGAGPDPLSVSLADLAGLSLDALSDRSGARVGDRGAQTAGYTAPSQLLSYQRNSAQGVSDLRDFVVYNARGQGHLNSDGLCFVQPTEPPSY